MALQSTFESEEPNAPKTFPVFAPDETSVAITASPTNPVMTATTAVIALSFMLESDGRSSTAASEVESTEGAATGYRRYRRTDDTA